MILLPVRQKCHSNLRLLGPVSVIVMCNVKSLFLAFEAETAEAQNGPQSLEVSRRARDPALNKWQCNGCTANWVCGCVSVSSQIKWDVALKKLIVIVCYRYIGCNVIIIRGLHGLNNKLCVSHHCKAVFVVDWSQEKITALLSCPGSVFLPTVI